MAIKNFEQFTTDELLKEVERRRELERENRIEKLHPLSSKYIDEIIRVVKDHGEYTFYDHTDESMDIPDIMEELSNLDTMTVGRILSECLDTTEVKQEMVTHFLKILMDCIYEDRDDYDEIYNSDKRFKELW